MFVQPPAPLVADVALLLAVLPFPYPPSSGIKVKDNSNSFNIAPIFFFPLFQWGWPVLVVETDLLYTNPSSTGYRKGRILSSVLGKCHS